MMNSSLSQPLVVAVVSSTPRGRLTAPPATVSLPVRIPTLQFHVSPTSQVLVLDLVVAVAAVSFP